MKTIEERAKAFCEAKICPQCGNYGICNHRCLTQCIPTDKTYDLLIEFAKSERENLTRWNDPKEAPLDKPLLLKDEDGDYGVGKLVSVGKGRCWNLTNCDLSNIIGWREIH